MSELEIWLTAKEAVNHLSPTYGRPEAAKAVLIDRIRDGAIPTRAAQVISYDPARGFPAQLLSRRGFERRSTKTSQRQGIDAAVWQEGTNWAADSGKWDWKNGDFEVSRRPMGQNTKTTIFHARGVEFRKLDIEALAGVAFAQLPIAQEPHKGGAAADEAAPKPGRKRGRKRKSEWDGWIAELTVEMVLSV